MSSFSVPPGPYPPAAPPPPYQQRPVSKAMARTAGGAMAATMPSVNGIAEVPTIYRATYSGIAVYEMMINGINVMRRITDDWLNATQLLKVANVDKPKRTKILEKLINAAHHEKVQGGYGKYQGTWITFEQGSDFARTYGVEHMIRPLLEYDPVRMGIETPSKEQALAAARQRRYTSGIENRGPGQGANDTYVKRISPAAYNALTVINKAGMDSRPPRPSNAARRPSSQQQQHLQPSLSQEYAFPGSSQRSTQSMMSDANSDVNAMVDSTYGTQHLGKRPPSVQNGHIQEPPRKRMRPSSSADIPNSQETAYEIPVAPGTPTEPNLSFTFPPPAAESMVDDQPSSGPLPLPPLPEPSLPEEKMQLSLLQTLFFDKDADYHQRNVLGRLSGPELDWPIDEHAHTALHWAATLGQLKLVRALIKGGASIFRVNNNGETALMRACLTTNNADDDTFHGLLEEFGPTIVMRDSRRRTVLHHIALSSGIPGREASTKHYLEALLGYVIKQPSSTAASREASFHGGQDHPAGDVRPTSLGRFISEIVNAEDDMGDTALNIAARAGSKNIVEQLLEIGADASLPNRIGLKPSEFGVGEPVATPTGAQDPANTLDLSEQNIHQTVMDRCQPLFSAMRTYYNEIEREMYTAIRDQTLNLHRKKVQMREAMVQLRAEREDEERRRREQAARTERRQKIARLQRAVAECRAQLTGEHPVNGDIDPRLTQNGSNSANFLQDPIGPVDLTSLNMFPQERLKVLLEHNADLQRRVNDLHDRSFEPIYARIVSLATGRDDAEHAEQDLATLTTAVQSEGAGDVEITRVRGFLRKIRELEEDEL